MPYDGFISYDRRDLLIAQDVFEKLAAEGFKVWFDRARLNPGCDWHEEIEAACENSRVVIPILTPRWGQKEWTKYETYGAESILPLLCEGDWASIATPPLERYQAENLEIGRLEAGGWSSLFTSLRNMLTQAPPQKLQRVAHLRFRANEYFVGREGDLIRLHEELHHRPSASLSTGRARVIVGMGGSGKTTLARQYAEKLWRCYTQMFWVDCRMSFESQFANIYDILFPDRAHIGLKDSDKAPLALAALGSQETRLLVLDNAEDEKVISDWIPTSGGCHILITSRYDNWSAAVKPVRLDMIDKAEAVQFLQRRSGRAHSEEVTDCETLAHKLGYLPLALEQAAAYVEQQGDGFTFKEYLHLYDEAAQELLEIGARGSTQYPDPVVTTWKPTIDALTPGARAILAICAYFAATPISLKMLYMGLEVLLRRTARFSRSSEILRPSSGEVWVRRELNCLKAYSMVRLDGQNFLLHPLLQLVDRINTAPEQVEQAKADASALFRAVLPPALWRDDRRREWTPEAEPLWKLLLPHGESLLKFCSASDPELHSSAASVFASMNEFHKALENGLEAQALFLAQLGPNHVRTIAALEDLGYLYRKLGNDRKSLEAFARVYEVRLELGGAEDEDTLRALHNVAIQETRLANFQTAESEMRRVTEARRRLLGADQYDTTMSVNDMGWLLQANGNYQAAIPYFKEAAEVWERTLSPDHSDTVDALQNLGHSLWKSGSYDEAERVMLDVVARREKSLGADNIMTLGSMNVLGCILQQKGQFKEAEGLHQRALDGTERVLGPGDADVLLYRSDLAMSLYNQKQHDEAIQMMEGAYETAQRALGPEHSNTKLLVRNLAQAYSLRGDLAKSEPLYRLILEEADRDPNKNLLELAVLLNNYAILLRKLHRFREAEPLARRALVIDESGREPEDPIIPHRLNNLAVLLVMEDRLEEAKDILARAWRLKAGDQDVTSTRILFVRLSVAYVERAPEAVYIGQLRTLITGEPVSVTGNISSSWDIGYFVDFLLERALLAPEKARFLMDLIATLNDPKQIFTLDGWQGWKEQTPMKLDQPWP